MVRLLVVLLLVLGMEVSGRQLLESQAIGLEKNISCILVFGDSTVDPGNNNHLNTTMKANFEPYGVDFLDGRPTGRHSAGKLRGDLIAQMLGISNTTPAFLDLPNLTPSQLLSGVSFASAGSGFDETTDESQNVLSFPKQIELLKEYKLKLTSLFGATTAEESIENALIIISAGTTDFIQNYFSNSSRSEQFTVEKYVDFLIFQLSKYVEDIRAIGPKRFLLSELVPIGCLPIMRTRFGEGSCYDPINKAAIHFNSKQAIAAAELMKKLDIRITINPAYDVMYYAIATPGKFGFVTVEKGCCGNGTLEYGETCKGKELCANPMSYLFFDAVHPSEKMYSYITGKLKDVDLKNDVLSN